MMTRRMVPVFWGGPVGVPRISLHRVPAGHKARLYADAPAGAMPPGAPAQQITGTPGPCVECSAFLLSPIVPLINPNYASPTSARMIQHCLGDFEGARRGSPVAIRRRSCSPPTPVLAKWCAFKIISDEPA